MTRDALHQALLEAHASEDLDALVRLYTEAGNGSEAAGDIDAACFFLTHAYVFALQGGRPEAETLNRRLAAHGRASLLAF